MTGRSRFLGDQDRRTGPVNQAGAQADAVGDVEPTPRDLLGKSALDGNLVRPERAFNKGKQDHVGLPVLRVTFHLLPVRGRF